MLEYLSTDYLTLCYSRRSPPELTFDALISRKYLSKFKFVKKIGYQALFWIQRKLIIYEEWWYLLKTSNKKDRGSLQFWILKIVQQSLLNLENSHISSFDPNINKSTFLSFYFSLSSYTELLSLFSFQKPTHQLISENVLWA